jgi:hypothetical protein
MLMDWQNPHSKNGYITKSNLHVQHNFHQNSKDIHHRDKKNSTLKFIWKHNGPQIIKGILNKRRNAGGDTVPNFKVHYRAMAIKTAYCCHKNRNKSTGTAWKTHPTIYT